MHLSFSITILQIIAESAVISLQPAHIFVNNALIKLSRIT